MRSTQCRKGGWCEGGCEMWGMETSGCRGYVSVKTFTQGCRWLNGSMEAYGRFVEGQPMVNGVASQLELPLWGTCNWCCVKLC